MPGQFGEARREVGQAQVRVGFPDPVRGGFGYGLEALFAGLQRVLGGRQVAMAAVDAGACAHRMAGKQGHGQGDEQHRDGQRDDHGLDQFGAGLGNLPGQDMAAAFERQQASPGRVAGRVAHGKAGQPYRSTQRGEYRGVRMRTNTITVVGSGT